MILELKNRPSDLCAFEGFEFEFFLLSTGSHDHFNGLNGVSTTDKFFEVDGQGLLVFIMCPFEMGRWARIEVSDMAAVWTVFRMIMSCMSILFVGLGIPMVVVMVVVVIMLLS